ncbi:hypothetical protein CQZ94_24960 [Bacillus sp. MYb209]|uniref:hypothetical protein n=1 Tax=Bacillus sp. MYb209 TaxID=1848605 RepID=UPI000CFB8926|nr:hypothetical protein [Bacillus sp. MYb209]PQZ52250.1 hypothetical protein CQZ94_24960 [Bacillus sp. MYb209]
MLEVKHVRVGNGKTSYFVLNKEGDIILSTEKEFVLDTWCNHLGIVKPQETKVATIDGVTITTYKMDRVIKHKEFLDKKEVPKEVLPCIIPVQMKDCEEYMEVIAYVHIDDKATTIYTPSETSDLFVELYAEDIEESSKELPFLNYNL